MEAQSNTSRSVLSCFIRNNLPNLQVQNKWQKDTNNMKEGAVVLLMEPRGQWPVGKVSRIIHSQEGRIRTVEVTSKDGKYIRPVARLVILSPVPDPKN